MPECPQCGVVYLGGERHECRAKTASLLPGRMWYVGLAVYSLVLALPAIPRLGGSSLLAGLINALTIWLPLVVIRSIVVAIRRHARAR